MTKEEFIGKLQMVYVGDWNAFNEIANAYDDSQQRINKTKEYINEHKEISSTEYNDYTKKYGKYNLYLINKEIAELEKILDGEE